MHFIDLFSSILVVDIYNYYFDFSIAGAPQNQHLARYEIEMVLQGQSHNLGSYGSVAPAGASSAYGAGSGAMGGQMQTGWNQYGAAGAYGTTPSYGFDMQQQAYYGQQQQAAAQQVQGAGADGVVVRM